MEAPEVRLSIVRNILTHFEKRRDSSLQGGSNNVEYLPPYNNVKIEFTVHTVRSYTAYPRCFKCHIHKKISILYTQFVRCGNSLHNSCDNQIYKPHFKDLLNPTSFFPLAVETEILKQNKSTNSIIVRSHGMTEKDCFTLIYHL